MAWSRFEPDTFKNKCAGLGLGNCFKITLLHGRKHRYQQTAVKRSFLLENTVMPDGTFLYTSYIITKGCIECRLKHDYNYMFRLTSSHLLAVHIIHRKEGFFLHIVVCSLSTGRYVPKQVAVNCTLIIKICV
jgi:hypothetical protein